MIIKLDAVLLRRPEPRDQDRLYAFRNDYQVVRHLGGFSRGFSSKDIAEWIEVHRTRNDEVLWCIADKEQDLCLGHVGLYQIDHRVRCAEFGILIGDASWWGRGVGSAVTSAVVAYGFRELNLHRIQLSVLASNERAMRMYEKQGFSREGVLRDAQFREGRFVDVILMALLESDGEV
jgi:RimJ/RimL family protein N-acetyltransferase